MFVPCIPNERWYVVSFFPQYKNEPACTNSPTPDDWFPEFPTTGDPQSRVGIRYRYSYTPEAMRARNTCLNCPAFDEQRLRNIETTSLTFSYNNPLDIDIKPRIHKESEWADEL